MEYSKKPKAKGSGRYKYDKGYTPSDGVGSYYGGEMRGNNYASTQDKIAKADHAKLKAQKYDNMG